MERRGGQQYVRVTEHKFLRQREGGVDPSCVSFVSVRLCK